MTITAPSPLSTDELLYGSDPTPRIIAVEFAAPNRITVMFRNAAGAIETTEETFRPWLLAARHEPWGTLRPAPRVEELAGDHPLRYLVTFDTWQAWADATRAARESGERSYRVSSAVEQFLMRAGKTLFKDMVYDDLVRLQLDIETLGLDASQPTARIVMIALRRGDGHEEVLTLDGDEGALLERLNERIRALDPDVIEGHNIFNFDIPFLAARAARFGAELHWGRDGSTVWIGSGQQRFKVAALTLPFTPCSVYGRHVIDTYQQIQRYDAGGRLTSYGLKNAVEALGLTRPDREFVPGEQVAKTWRENPTRLERYALDDVRDVDTLSRLAMPTEFYQSQLLPRSLQRVATGGPGEKINDLMVRAYLLQGHSVPMPSQARDYPGGHTELIEVGMFHPVVKCDVESLYPSIMLQEQVTSRSDTLGAYLPMLRELTRRRLDAKSHSRRTHGAEQAMWDGMQGSFKVLINSFYGYLGYGRGLFNDFDAAEQVTRSGHRIIRQTVEALRETGARPIEVDTDGVYFVPPPDIDDEDAEHAYIDRIGAKLPPGIRLTHDGRYRAMLSLRLKTYGLLTEDDHVILKGSALRNRRMEPCFRAFLRDATRDFLSDDRDEARERYFRLAERIRSRVLDVSEFSQWAMLHDDTLANQPRLKRLVERLPSHIRSGERIEIYERQDGELALVEEYQSDENVPYLLRRLYETAARFQTLFDSEAEYEAFFPRLSPRTDLATARAQEAAHQLGLF
ncbi:MAG: DNA polymerase domain-containing protein [Thermomicrobiales bacterium]